MKAKNKRRRIVKTQPAPSLFQRNISKGISKRYVEKEHFKKRSQGIFSFKQSCVFSLLNAPCAWKCHILEFRPRPKSCFCRFLFVRRGGNAAFLFLRLSAAAETHFLLFYSFQPRRKWYFCCFLLVRHGGNAVFRHFLTFIHGWRTVFYVFHISSAEDEHFCRRWEGFQKDNKTIEMTTEKSVQ